MHTLSFKAIERWMQVVHTLEHQNTETTFGNTLTNASVHAVQACAHTHTQTHHQRCRSWHTTITSLPNICCNIYNFNRTSVCHWDAHVASWASTSASLTSALCLFRGQVVSLDCVWVHLCVCVKQKTPIWLYFRRHFIYIIVRVSIPQYQYVTHITTH